jgi:hypothetical protein
MRAYLAAIAVFCNEVKGKSMLALSRDLSVSATVDSLSRSGYSRAVNGGRIDRCLYVEDKLRHHGDLPLDEFP